MSIHIDEDQTCTLEFTHVNGQDSKLHVACNPLTGDWLQVHRIGENETVYVGDKSSAMKMVNAIVQKSHALGLPCEVIIKEVKS